MGIWSHSPFEASVPDWRIDLASKAVGFWGFWLFLFGSVFIVIFCKPIAAFIGRTKRVGAGKWGAEAEEQKPDQKISAPVIEPLAQGDGSRTGDPRAAADKLLEQIQITPYMRGLEDNFKKTLAERGLDEGSRETYRVLTAIVTSAYVAIQCEQLYNVIWTTQLHLLNEANSRELTENELRPFYDLGAPHSPAIYNKYPFTEYLRFLTTQELLVVTAAGKYAITVKGRMLLTYLVDKGRALTGRVY